MARMSIERCAKETGHAQVKGTGFCKCTHAMYYQPPKKRPRCSFAKGGGGRLCAHPEGKGHKGNHYYECGAHSDLWE